MAKGVLESFNLIRRMDGYITRKIYLMNKKSQHQALSVEPAKCVGEMWHWTNLKWDGPFQKFGLDILLNLENRDWVLVFIHIIPEWSPKYTTPLHRLHCWSDPRCPLIKCQIFPFNLLPHKVHSLSYYWKDTRLTVYIWQPFEARII